MNLNQMSTLELFKFYQKVGLKLSQRLWWFYVIVIVVMVAVGYICWKDYKEG